MFEITPDWEQMYPGAHAGILAMRKAVNPPQSPELDEEKRKIENALRSQYSGSDRASLLALPVLQAYEAYYKHFKKTYHVQLQLESILFKGKSIPSVSALVETMFMAELKNGLLTAGHDLDSLRLPARLDVSRGNESYMLIRGESQTLKTGDMFISDQTGILSSIIYGPDDRTRIREQTTNVLYTVYAPSGIPADTVRSHLQDIARYIHLFAPLAQQELLQVYPEGK